MRRPGLVTLIGVIIYIQAAMAAAAAIVTIGFSGSDQVRDEVGLSSAGMIWTGIWEAVMAVLLFLVGGGIMRGSRGFRLLVAVVIGIRMVSAVILMLVHHTGGYLFNGIIAVILGLFVLWALYGNERSDEYFLSRS
jgi:hypothetical protein